MKKKIVIHIAIILSCTAYGMDSADKYKDLHLVIISPDAIRQKKIGRTLSLFEKTDFKLIDITKDNANTIIALLKHKNGTALLRAIKYAINGREYNNKHHDMTDFLTIEQPDNKIGFCSSSEPETIQASIESYFPHLLNRTYDEYMLGTTTACTNLIAISHSAIKEKKVGLIIAELENNDFEIKGIKKACIMSTEKAAPVIITALAKVSTPTTKLSGTQIYNIKENDASITFIDTIL
ncbi:MAG: hypothetical protein WC707_06710 [Candidatus Babeliaceae bacterium]|jgi:nucleoside diphosphate kinase